MYRRFINWFTEASRRIIAENEKQRKFLEDEIIEAFDKKDWDRAAILQQIMDDRFRR